jgi:hypothetical protein
MGWCGQRLPNGSSRLMTPTRRADDPRKRTLVLALSLMSCAILGASPPDGWADGWVERATVPCSPRRAQDKILHAVRRAGCVVMVGWESFSGRATVVSPSAIPPAVFFHPKPKHTTTAMVLSHLHELATSDLADAGAPVTLNSAGVYLVLSFAAAWRAVLQHGACVQTDRCTRRVFPWRIARLGQRLRCDYTCRANINRYIEQLCFMHTGG